MFVRITHKFGTDSPIGNSIKSGTLPAQGELWAGEGGVYECGHTVWAALEITRCEMPWIESLLWRQYGRCRDPNNNPGYGGIHLALGNNKCSMCITCAAELSRGSSFHNNKLKMALMRAVRTMESEALADVRLSFWTVLNCDFGCGVLFGLGIYVCWKWRLNWFGVVMVILLCD